MNLLEDQIAIPIILGGRQPGLELPHLVLAVVSAFQLHPAFDHVHGSFARESDRSFEVRTIVRGLQETLLCYRGLARRQWELPGSACRASLIVPRRPHWP